MIIKHNIPEEEFRCTKCRQKKEYLWSSCGWMCEECVSEIQNDPQYQWESYLHMYEPDHCER